MGTPRNEEQMSDRHAVAAGEEETQHEENGMRDIHTANDEEPDKLRKTIRYEQEASNISSS